MRPGQVVLLSCAAAALCLVSLWPAATAVRALGIFPMNGHSRNIFFKALMESLAERGHQVTMLSPFPLKTPKANYTDVDLSKELPSLVNTFTYEMMTDTDSAGTVAGLVRFISDDIAGNGLCRTMFESQQFRDIMQGKYGEFDVVLTEVFGSDCFAAVAHKMKLPLIGVTSAPDVAWMHDRVGSVDNPAYIGNVFGSYLGKMNFFQRVHNVYWWFVTNYLHRTLMVDGSDDLVRQYLGADMPPLSQIVKNTSLILVNRHVSIHAARPVPPNVVHVGGLHVRSTQKQTKSQIDPELRSWLDGAEHGVILFSLGSLVQSSTLPKHVQRDILLAFSSLPQRVLWKFEVDIPDLPTNVRITKWMPQSEILVHPKLILFITHGGLMGTTEALMAGVPMLGIPLFADQMTNIDLYRKLGIAERLEHWKLNRDYLTKKIKQMTQDNRYLRRAREVAELYRDRPRSAAEEAVWWVEYVVRHRGAPHLRPLGADLPWYEYLLLDVAAAALAVLLLTLFMLRSFILTVCSLLRPRQGGSASPKQRKVD